MNKHVRTIAWILGLLFLLQIGGIVVLQSPRVQTYLGRKVIENMQDRMDADITFGQASVRPFDAIVLEDVLVMDRAPQVPSMDTLLFVKQLSARFSIMGLFKGQSINVSRLNLDGGCFHLVIEKDPYREGHTSTNLQRIFRIQHKEESSSVYEWGNILRARSVVISQIHFRMENLPGDARHAERGVVVPEGVIDWNHLNLILEHLKVSNLRIQDIFITASAQEMYVQELETGLRLENLSSRKVRVGEGNVHLDDFHGMLSPGSVLDIPSLDLNGLLDDYGEFEEKISLDVVLAEGTSVDMRSVSHFSPGLEDMGFRGKVRGHVYGPVANLNISDVTVEGLDEGIIVKTTGRITGLPETDQTRLDFQLKEVSLELKDLDDFIEDWAPGVNLHTDHMAPDERFTITGNLTGLLDRMTFEGDIDSRIGQVSTRLTLSHAVNRDLGPLSIGGEVETRDLHLDRILGRKELGAVSLTSRLEAVLPHSGNMRVQLDTLYANRLQLLGYNYSGIEARGHYETGDIDLLLRAEDPNLRMNVQGVYKASSARDAILRGTVQLGHANLEALNLDKRGKSLVQMAAEAHITRENGDATGSVTTSGTILENEGGRHTIPDIRVQIEEKDSHHSIALRSDMLDADFQGDRPVTEFWGDIRRLFLQKELSALTDHRVQPYSGATYKAGFSVKRKLQELLAFVTPGVYVDNGTRAQLSISPEGLLQADVTSGRVALREQFIKDMKLHLDNDYDALTGEITGSTIAIGGIRLSNSRFTFYADDNQLGMGYVFDNEAEENTHAQLYATGELERTDRGIGITARALPSNLYYKGEGWGITSGEIRYLDGSIHIDRLLARHEDQQLLVNGGYSRGQADTLSVTMDQFDLGLANTVGGESMPRLEGRITGSALLISSADPTPGLLASLVCDSTTISRRRLGQLTIQSIWDDENEVFRARMHNTLDGRNSIRANAFLAPATQEAQVNMELDHFEMGYAGKFLESIFQEFAGALSGDIQLSGKTRQLKMTSQHLRLDDGLLTLDFTRVPYHVEGPLSLDSKGLHFNGLSVTDGEGGTGVVTGGIEVDLARLDDVRMDTHVTMQQMRALALPRGVNPLAYGNMYATGKVDITGPLNRIVLAIDATSTKSGEFHLPLGSASSGSSTELLTFKNAPTSIDEDPYEQMMQVARETHRRQSDLRFTARIKATPELRAFIDIGDNTLNAVGSGTIEVESSNAQGFSLGGDYTIQDGNFHFSALNVVSRNFTIQDGSTVRFNGDVWDTDLDVKGRYTTKASLSNLLPSYTEEGETGGSGRRTVYCGINITGKIRNPEVDFDIEVPDLNPVIQGQVESALNSEDKVQKQFVYLLIAGNFLPTDESGITSNGSEVLLSNVSSIMSGQLNNIFQKLNIPLDLGLNYQTTQAGRDLFDVAVSTQLFNNRVIVNGTVGNKQLVGGATTNEIAGDLDIEIKLNRSGSLRMSLFSHSADQYTYYLDNSQRNGGGITYQREFNSFGQFFRELFASRRKREEMAIEAARSSQESVVLQIDTTGKSKMIHELR